MLVFLIVPLLLIGLVKLIFGSKPVKSLLGKHVVVTGGSSGIGKSVAVLATKMGANVTIIARNEENLLKTVTELKDARINQYQIIKKVSVDVSNCKLVQEILLDLDTRVAPIYMLINCAGMAICGKVEDFSEDDIRKLLDINLLGTFYPIQAVVPRMKQRQEGIIVITASQVALMGMYGYSIYSACKFALRGLAESITMELKPYNISVTLSLPPDTDTPGFENENKTKPEETRLISESGGLFKPEQVAQKLLHDALNGHFFSYIGFESFILTTLCTGMSQFSSYLELLVQVALLGVLRLIGAFYLSSFNTVIKKCHLNTKKEQ